VRVDEWDALAHLLETRSIFTFMVQFRPSISISPAFIDRALRNKHKGFGIRINNSARFLRPHGPIPFLSILLDQARSLSFSPLPLQSSHSTPQPKLYPFTSVNFGVLSLHHLWTVFSLGRTLSPKILAADWVDFNEDATEIETVVVAMKRNYLLH
jgi:hypothetical protein